MPIGQPSLDPPEILRPEPPIPGEDYPAWRCSFCGTEFDDALWRFIRPPRCPECHDFINVEKNLPPQPETRDPGDRADEAYQRQKDGD